jgi:hypothetical protein
MEQTQTAALSAQRSFCKIKMLEALHQTLFLTLVFTFQTTLQATTNL